MRVVRIGIRGLVPLPDQGARQVKTRQQLMEQGYPHDTFVSDRTIDSHIKRLRKKFVTIDPAFDEIETVYGLGYRYREAAS